MSAATVGRSVRGPRDCSEAELKRVGVLIVDTDPAFIVACAKCGGKWVLGNPGKYRRQPAGYWHCQHSGCNVPE
jgi:hypothetical protein